MPKQSFDLIDYFGPLAVWIVFFSVIFVISVTCILWCCISETDDITVFAKWGIGPTNPRQIRRPLILAQQRHNWHKQLRQQHKMRVLVIQLLDQIGVQQKHRPPF
ncbi:hypothetical protein niasHS_013415 [Heterodera schachtii]|uniref:Uncharacterized protein n=1 Tax=Heterodera schachtii TaxID=97005 RepID=A0ABD2I7Y0_HETSC